MAEASKTDLNAVLQKLSDTIEALDHAVEVHLEHRQRLSSTDEEISELMLDRSRLAQSWDKAEARATRLEDANKEVSRRLVKAMDSIRTILEAQNASQNHLS